MSYSLHHIPTRQEAYEILNKMKVADLVELAKRTKFIFHVRIRVFSLTGLLKAQLVRD